MKDLFRITARLSHSSLKIKMSLRKSLALAT
jgi:hypothetical protein